VRSVIIKLGSMKFFELLYLFESIYIKLIRL